MSQLQDMGRQVIKNNEKAADTIYQRKPGGPEMIAPVLKLLITFTELLVQSGKADRFCKAGSGQRGWRSYFGCRYIAP